MVVRGKAKLLALSAIAVAGGAAGMQGLDVAEADHRGDADTPVLSGVTPGGGKFYDDREAGQCGLSDWVCYMTLWADNHFTDSEVSSWVTGAKNDWNATDTTLFIDLRSDQNTAYDIHFKMSTLPNGVFAQVSWGDYHNNGCTAGDCNDPDGIAAHQPQRWWYTYVQMDKAQIKAALPTYAKRKALISNEIGHTFGLAHHPQCDGGPHTLTIMDFNCITNGEVEVPQPADMCELNHDSSPLLYGNDPNRRLHWC